MGAMLESKVRARGLSRSSCHSYYNTSWALRILALLAICSGSSHSDDMIVPEDITLGVKGSGRAAEGLARTDDIVLEQHKWEGQPVATAARRIVYGHQTPEPPPPTGAPPSPPAVSAAPQGSHPKMP